MKILVICLGNICRSPLAAAVLEAYVDKFEPELLCNLSFSSAGTYSHTQGRPVDPRSMKVAIMNQQFLPGVGKLLASHKAQTVSIEDIIESDYILVMDLNNMADIKSIIKNSQKSISNDHHHLTDRIHLFGNFINTNPKLKDVIIEDPWYGSPSDFENVYSQCHSAAKGFISYIKSKHFRT